MAEAVFFREIAQRQRGVTKAILRSLGMTTNTDTMRWSVIVPMLVFLGGGAVTMAWTGASVSTNVTALTGDMKDIKDNVKTLASSTTHIADEVNHGSTRMDTQDRHIADIDGQLAAIRQQLFELREQVDRQQVSGSPRR